MIHHFAVLLSTLGQCHKYTSVKGEIYHIVNSLEKSSLNAMETFLFGLW